MPRISENLREMALGMLEAGCTTAEVAARVGASVTCRGAVDCALRLEPKTAIS